ncbi:hypothetical protein FVP74_12010 [Microbacterium saccharophilum]|uniref:Uncharacterized protein n=1 Tax=Microbacterium saccharophilum TaxID=1213358 RepID=A0A5C8HS92_9MICO|nr:hypothetical protein [Microbacterium saccharophilum]TXK08814.1 hypothetical protein FVP74_12010 [Microbacterium saccharophilum]GEP49190.1 hypothetical protein MSA03_26980 [Microbacterium saccharophilum]
MTTDDADEIIRKTAMLALLYYPELHADDPDYSLAGDVAWVLDHITAPDPDATILRDAIGRAIIDPTAHRADLAALVYAATPSAS